jgi:hypothetical protein
MWTIVLCLVIWPDEARNKRININKAPSSTQYVSAMINTLAALITGTSLCLLSLFLRFSHSSRGRYLLSPITGLMCACRRLSPSQHALFVLLTAKITPTTSHHVMACCGDRLSLVAVLLKLSEKPQANTVSPSPTTKAIAPPFIHPSTPPLPPSLLLHPLQDSPLLNIIWLNYQEEVNPHPTKT